MFEIFPWEMGKKFVTIHALYVTSRLGNRLTIPKGFEHDSYSVAPNLKGTRPAVIHDFAYQQRCWDDESEMSRREADELLLDAMRASPDWLTRIAAMPYWLGVRALGWTSW